MDQHDTGTPATPDPTASADPYGSPALAVRWMLWGLAWVVWIGYLVTAPPVFALSLDVTSLAFTVVAFGVIPGAVITLLAAILQRLRRLGD